MPPRWGLNCGSPDIIALLKTTVKQKRLIIATIIFFLLVNTTYYWEAKMGGFAMLTLLLSIVYFLALFFLLLGEIYFSIREMFNNRHRLFVVGIVTVVLTLSFLYPGGLIDFEKFESDIILTAQREGAANCMTTLKLRKDGSFVERNVCFGVTETAGTYEIKGDTVFFENISLGRNKSKFYKFAVLKNQEIKTEKYLGDLVRYTDYSDTTGLALQVLKNNLTKR